MKRKIAAILAADIAGYTRLVGEDEEETLRRLENYRAVFDDFIARFGGRVFNTAGDAILAEFSSAVDAVRCAVDTQESLRTRNLAYPASRQMNFRIGITIGDVVEREGDLLGEGVNIASRLEGIAAPGGICISRSVHEQVANKLSLKFEDAGEQQLKNLPTPVHAYRVAPERLASQTGVKGSTIWTPQHLLTGAGIAALFVIGLSAVLRTSGDGVAPAPPAGEEAKVASAGEPLSAAALEVPPAKQPEPLPVETARAVIEGAGRMTAAIEPAPAPPPAPPNAEVPDTDACMSTHPDAQEAISACNRLLADPDISKWNRSAYLNNRGAIYINLGDYDRAIEDLDAALVGFPTDPIVLRNRGRAYFFKEEYEDAIRDLTIANKSDPKSSTGPFYLGRALAELGRYDEAVANYSKSIRADNTDSETYRYRADAFLDKGDYRSALGDYNQALRLKSDYAEAYRGRGITNMWLERNDDAVADFTKAIELDGTDWYARYNRAYVYSITERFDEAVADDTAALEIDPGNARVLNGRADILMRAGRLDEAEADVARALAVNPEFALAIATRGEINELRGKREAAIADFKRALEIEPDQADAKKGLERLDPKALATSSGGAEAGDGSGSCSKFLASIGRTISVPCGN